MELYKIETIASRELELYAVHNGELYSQSLLAIHKMVEKRYKNGTYDFAKSVKAYKKFADIAAKAYLREHFSPGDAGFSAQDRWKTAYSIAETHLAEMEIGNFH